MKTRLGLLLIVVALLVPLAVADTISDKMTVYDPTGAIYRQMVVYESNEDPNRIYYINDPLLVDLSMFGRATTLLEANGSYSDIFGVAFVDGGYFLAFNSDTEYFPAAYGGQGYFFYPETHAYWDATMYLAPELRAQGFHAQFYSDTEIPEPGTMILMGTGLLALARKLRK